MTSPFTADGDLAPVPDEPDPWQLFGLEEQARADTAALKRAYLDLSRKLHPDRFQAKGGQQLERAEGWSTALNDAWRTLKQTPARLQALLHKHGLMPEEGTQGEKTPQEFLMEVFELREALEELGDAAPDDATRVELQAKLDDFKARMQALKQRFEELAEAWDDKPAERKASAEKIVETFGHQRFFQRLIDELNKALARS